MGRSHACLATSEGVRGDWLCYQMHVCRLCVEGADVLLVAAVCVEALTNFKAANRALSIHGFKQPLAEGQGVDGVITRLFGAI